MSTILPYIGFVALGALILYLIVNAIIENVKRQEFRRANREAQFSGSANKEEKGFWETLVTPKYRSKAEAIGEKGEKKVSSYLEDLDCNDYRVYNDLLIRNGRYTTQVDHVIISHYGVFVLETKNYHGKIYGSGNAEFWNQFLPSFGYKRFGFTQKHQLRNPLLQNTGHVKTLRRVVFGNDIPIYGIVVFPNDAKLKVTTNQPVLSAWELVPYIKRFRDVVLSSDQMDFYRRRLLEVISTSESDRKQHVVSVNRNKENSDAAIARGKCPRCGGNLILRRGEYGNFYGCSNYPRCKFTLNT